MANYFDIPAITAVLKEFYDDQSVENMVYDGSPLFGIVKKNERLEGKYYPVPLQYGVVGGGSANFAKAQTNQSAPKLKEFVVTPFDEYGIGTLTTKAMRAAATSKGAFVEAVKMQVDSAIRQVKNSLSKKLFRSGTGSIGKIGTIGTVGTGVIALDDPESVTNFEYGDVIIATDTDGGTQQGAAGFIVGVDRDNGYITVAATFGGAPANLASWAATNFIVRDGDLNNSITGLQGWIPAVRPVAGENFFGVDRSSDTSRCAGVFLNVSGMSIEEGLIKTATRLAREGAEPDTVFLNAASYTALVTSIGSKSTYPMSKIESSDGEISFEGVTLNGPTGPLVVIMDRFCPGKTAFVLTKDSWEFVSYGAAPGVIEYEKGNPFWPVGSADAREIRVGLFGNLICHAPGWNAQAQLGE